MSDVQTLAGEVILGASEESWCMPIVAQKPINTGRRMGRRRQETARQSDRLPGKSFRAQRRILVHADSGTEADKYRSVGGQTQTRDGWPFRQSVGEVILSASEESR